MSRRNVLNGYISTNSGGGDYTYDEYFGLIPPESKTFEFPLYITVPFEKVQEGVYINYLKDNDDIVKQLYQYCVKDVDIGFGFGSVELENIPNIYINGCKVDSIFVESVLGVNSKYEIFIRLSHIWSYECNIYYDGGISITLLTK